MNNDFQVSGDMAIWELEIRAQCSRNGHKFSYFSGVGWDGCARCGQWSGGVNNNPINERERKEIDQ